MSRKVFFTRSNHTHSQINKVVANMNDCQNGHENQEELYQAEMNEETLLEEEMKNKCNISNQMKVEQGQMPTYYYQCSPMPAKKINSKSQEVFYPTTFQEAAQAYQRPDFPAESNHFLTDWDGNPQKQYEQKEMPHVVYGYAANYQCETYQNYMPAANTPNSQENFKAWTASQYDFPPASNGGTYMKVYYWQPNIPNVYRPGGPPIPLKNVDVYAKMSGARDFSDLPLDDKETLRFFYNLGIEYFRLGSFIFPSPPPYPLENSNNSDSGKQEKYIKKRDYCRKSHLSQKSQYRTL